MRQERPPLPRRVRPAEERGRLRPGRLPARAARGRQARDREAPARGLPRPDQPADPALRGQEPAAPLRWRAPAGRGARPHPSDPRHAATRGGVVATLSSVIVRKTPEEIEKMAAAGRVLSRCLTLLRGKSRAGVTTGELDKAAEKFIRSQGGEPAFKGYRGFPGSICASPNSMVVHGIPGPYKLGRGDILSIDVGVILDGWVADAAITVPIGNVTPVAKRLLASTRAALFDAVEQCRPGNRLGDLGHAVQQRVETDGFSVVRSLVGHGIGKDMHEDPQIPNYGEPGTGEKLEEGMVLAVEPMVNVGNHPIRVAADNWSVYSQDGSLAAHFEHTVAITAEGPRILTPWHLEEAARAA